MSFEKPYTEELLWGTRFIEVYRKQLAEIYWTPEVLYTALQIHSASAFGGNPNIKTEKWQFVDEVREQDFYTTCPPVKYITDDVVNKGNSRNSAFISIYAYLMMVVTGETLTPKNNRFY